jgi:hypothetical protein
MTAIPKQQVPTHYSIRIGGHLDARWSAWFDGLVLTREAEGTTRLSGVVADQAALHGALTKVRDLGLVLVSVEAVGVVAPAEAVEAEGP